MNDQDHSAAVGPPALQALLEKWQRQATAWNNLEPRDHRAAQVIRWCAEELAAILTAPCPHGENCACAISTRHEWFVAFCTERDKWVALRALLEEISALQVYWTSMEGLVPMPPEVQVTYPEFGGWFNAKDVKALASKALTALLAVKDTRDGNPGPTVKEPQ